MNASVGCFLKITLGLLLGLDDVMKIVGLPGRGVIGRVSI